MSEKILVTGGTGVLGRRVVDRLHSAGVETRVLSHSEKPGTVNGDLLTGEGLDPAVRGIDTVIHCATSPFRKAREVDVEGTGRLIEAANRAGVSHLVYISIVGIDRAASYPYYRVKLDAERVIERLPGPLHHPEGDAVLRPRSDGLAVPRAFARDADPEGFPRPAHRCG